MGGQWSAENNSIEDVSVEMTDSLWSLDYQDGVWYPDGATYYMIDPNEIDGATGKAMVKEYYHPLTSEMEYKYGNWDPVNGSDVTLNPNKYDVDGDSVADGKEIFFMDYPLNASKASPYEDNDTLARGWEEIFNLSTKLFTTDYKPTGHVIAPDLYKGKFWPTKEDSDGNGVLDGDEDCDGDTWNNSAEYRGNSDPTDSSSVPNNDPYNLQPGRGGEQDVRSERIEDDYDVNEHKLERYEENEVNKMTKTNIGAYYSEKKIIKKKR